MLAGLSVGVRDGERVLDLCAAPGGKTTQLAQWAAEVVAVELNEGRARELQQTCRRLGAENVLVVQADGRELPPGLTGFDRALVDAPCSGSGVLAFRPDLRWRSQPLPELQLELLLSAAARVRPGGSVTFSTCAVHAAENELLADAAVAAAGGRLVLDDLGGEWPAFRHPRRPELLLTLPHVHGGAGFFVARFTVAAA
jgi:16S rRNA (cytosine967-C5)-methyltransferase